MLVLFLNWDLKYTGLVMNFGPVPFIPWGTTWRFGRSKNTQREGLYCPGLGVGSRSKEKDSNPTCVTDNCFYLDFLIETKQKCQHFQLYVLQEYTMFLHLSVSHCVHGGGGRKCLSASWFRGCTPNGQTPPGQTPPGHTPPG